ncbi:MAG: cation:proton antiporter [Bacteroidota bacterium]
MDILSTYNIIIEASVILILSFFFGEIAKRTNIPSVLLLILLGILLNLGIQATEYEHLDFAPLLEVLGVIGLIMIVLEAALELELKREKLVPILKAFGIALVGLLLSAWVAALILNHFIEGMDMQRAWLYAMPLSILSSAIIIPSVTGLGEAKKEFHIYESTFSDILGIIAFYFLTSQLHGDAEHGVDTAVHSSGGFIAYMGNVLLTVVISLVASYIIVLIFQNIKSSVKLFLLIAVLLLLYAVGKLMHLSSLIIILVFGLLIANMKLFFQPKFLSSLLNYRSAHRIYEGLHVVTAETAFVVRTFFFVVFGITIVLGSLKDPEVIMVGGFIILSIYLIRFVILRLSLGKDILPQLFIAPRGLITVLLFYAIPEEAEVEGFNAGILLFVIIATSLIMTFALIYDKRRSGQAISKAQNMPVGYAKWKAPSVESVAEKAQEVESGH